MAAKNFSDAHQRAAAGQVSVLIVDELQTVHVEEQHAEGALRAARAVQFGFQHADETAIIREARKGIADGHAAYLLEQARLVKQSAGEHHHVAERLAQLREEERPVEELARKGRGDVADRIQRGHHQQRIVEQAGIALLVFVILDALTEAHCGDQVQRGGKEVPGTRQNVFCIGNGRGGGSQKGRAGQVGRQRHYEQNRRGFLAWFARRGHVAFHGQRRKQQNREQCSADHPPQRNFRNHQRPGVERIVESKVADGLDDSRECKPERENQCGPVVRAAEAHERVRRIAITKKRSTDFQVKIGLRRCCQHGLPRVENSSKKEGYQSQAGS